MIWAAARRPINGRYSGLPCCVTLVTAANPGSQDNLMAEGWSPSSFPIARASAMAHFADKLHVDKQKIDRVESALLLSLIGGGLGLCVLGAAVYDIGRAFSAW